MAKRFAQPHQLAGFLVLIWWLWYFTSVYPWRIHQPALASLTFPNYSLLLFPSRLSSCKHITWSKNVLPENSILSVGRTFETASNNSSSFRIFLLLNLRQSTSQQITTIYKQCQDTMDTTLQISTLASPRSRIVMFVELFIWTISNSAPKPKNMTWQSIYN